MTAGVSRLPARGLTGCSTMTNSDKERGEKRGVLSSGRVNDREDADDAANDDED